MSNFFHSNSGLMLLHVIKNNDQRVGLVKAFLLAGDNPNASDAHGKSALARACTAGRDDWVKELVLSGADLTRCAIDEKPGRYLNVEDSCSKNGYKNSASAIDMFKSLFKCAANQSNISKKRL